jgi:hypothetical protein
MITDSRVPLAVVGAAAPTVERARSCRRLRTARIPGNPTR